MDHTVLPANYTTPAFQHTFVGFYTHNIISFHSFIHSVLMVLLQTTQLAIKTEQET